ncbi:MAG: hypothetical protein ACR65X_16040 [Methylocystis sp.]
MPVRVAVAHAEKVDAILALAASAIPLDREIFEQAAPQHDGRALERLIVGGLGNLSGGEQRHR